MFFPLILAVGLWRVGGESTMSVAVLMMVYSLNSKVIFPSASGKPVLPISGVILIRTGGSVSFGPPPGAVVVLAQEWLKTQQATNRPSRMAVARIRFMAQLISTRLTRSMPLTFESALISLSRSSVLCT